jgi:hypothetical protein
MVEIDCSWIFILFNKLITVSDHGRKGFANCFCLSANGFMSPTIVFVSLPKVFVFSPTAGRLRPWSERLRQLFLSLRKRFHVSDHCLCFFAKGFCLFANGKASPTIVFVSSTMVVMPASIVFASAIALFHSLNSCEPQSPCDDRQGVIKHPIKHYYWIASDIHQDRPPAFA